MGKKFTRKGIKYELDNNEITVVGLNKTTSPHSRDFSRE